MKKTSQNKTKLNSKYEGMALFEIEKDLLNVSEVKSPKLDLGSLEKDYKELALRHYSNFNQQTTEFLYKAYLQSFLKQDQEARKVLRDIVNNIAFENLKPYFQKEFKDFNEALSYYEDNYELVTLFADVHNLIPPKQYDESKLDDISNDDLFDVMRLDHLCSFYTSLKRSCYVSCCFAALFSSAYDAVHSKAKDQKVSSFDKRVCLIVSSLKLFIDRTFNAHKEYKWESLLNKFSDLIVSGLHKDLTVYDYSYQRSEKVASEVIIGVPGNVAFKIGQAFFNGTDLPLNKFHAKDWFAYGAAVGDIKCALAYILYFMDINFEKNGVAYDKIAFMHALLFNNFVASVDRCYRGAKGTIFGFIPLDSENTKLLEASIINLLNFYIDYHLKSKLCNVTGLEYYFKLAKQIFIDFSEVLKAIIDDYSYDPNLLPHKERLFSAVACFLKFDDSFNKNSLVKLLAQRCDIGYYGESYIDEVLLDIILKGIKKKDEYSYKAYYNYNIGIDTDLEEEIESKYLNKLSKQGFARATFILGKRARENCNDEKAVSYWKKASEQGDYLSFISLALSCAESGARKESIEYATRAVDRGMVLGYMVLYQEYLATDPMLAYTYLRYASEYLIPKATLKLVACKKEGTYKPLPFLRHFEQLEELSKEDAYACQLLSRFYALGIIMPCNGKKSLDYQLQSFSLGGGTSVLHLYDNGYQNFSQDTRNFSLFPTFREVLSSGSFDFIVNDAEEDVEVRAIGDKDRVDRIFSDIVNDLINGTTKLEHDILHNLKAHYCDIKLPKKLALKPSCLCYQELNELLLTGCYSITKFGSNQDEDIFKKNLEAKANLISNLDPKEDTSLAHDVFMYTLSARSGTQKVQYAKFKYYLQRAANGNFLSAILLNSIDFSSIIDEK